MVRSGWASSAAVEEHAGVRARALLTRPVSAKQAVLVLVVAAVAQLVVALAATVAL